MTRPTYYHSVEDTGNYECYLKLDADADIIHYILLDGGVMCRPQSTVPAKNHSFVNTIKDSCVIGKPEYERNVFLHIL
jgi:hypothetical protein